MFLHEREVEVEDRMSTIETQRIFEKLEDIQKGVSK